MKFKPQISVPQNPHFLLFDSSYLELSCFHLKLQLRFNLPFIILYFLCKIIHTHLKITEGDITKTHIPPLELHKYYHFTLSVPDLFKKSETSQTQWYTSLSDPILYLPLQRQLQSCSCVSFLPILKMHLPHIYAPISKYIYNYPGCLRILHR